MPVTDAVIPVAGLGTRLLPATRSQPKEMLPVLDRPVVQYVVEELVTAGVRRVLLVTGRRKRAIEDHFDADPELGSSPLLDPASGLQILYTRQARPAGLGDAIGYGRGLGATDGVMVALGDAILESAGNPSLSRRLIDTFEAQRPAAVIAVEAVAPERVSRYGIVAGPLEAITGLVEKPPAERAPSRWAVAARYVFAPRVLDALAGTPPDAGGEVQVADALNALIAGGERVIAVPLGPGERRHDIGTVEAYVATFVHFARADPRFSALLDG
ncbi:UTP--glucose-1-phosphate uridylyltransferase [Conexibacter sp. DBS9H8]|uniref:UTP--glucose-1-phosphate uridylyltransferase n=1 Tax=Conexibacter sp. DBS9H8 TaxID=2937801 RepID=UPI00200E2E92|nr:sugar phosphate nucleotidyltransferase [Conexibacter sp. DBS9H8]